MPSVICYASFRILTINYNVRLKATENKDLILVIIHFSLLDEENMFLHNAASGAEDLINFEIQTHGVICECAGRVRATLAMA